MSLDLMGLLLDLDLLPTPPRFRGLNMRRRPAPFPPAEDRDPDASDIDIEAPSPSLPATLLLFSRWNPSGERTRGLRTLDRFPLSFFFLDDDGGGDDIVELLAILLVDEYAARPPPPPREGISNGDGAGPRDRELVPRLATALPLLEAARNFIFVAFFLTK